MTTGQRDQWIRFEKASISRDAIGGVSRSWALHVETWAKVRQGGQAESDKAGKPTWTAARSFEILQQDQPITEDMRIVWNGLTYAIDGIDPDNFRSGRLTIHASADK